MRRVLPKGGVEDVLDVGGEGDIAAMFVRREREMVESVD